MHLQTRSVFTGVDGASYFDFVRGVLFMSELRKAAEQALEAMKRSNNRYLHGTRYMDVAITALCAALAQPDLLTQEIERLRAALRYEENRFSRIGTHGPDCWKWGPSHYECALRRINND